MSDGTKKYFWLKLKSGYFDTKQIKKLRRMAGGDTYTIIYLKMQLKALSTGGVIQFTGLEPNVADEIALDLDENPDDVRMTLAFLDACKLIETSDNINYLLPEVVENTGGESDSARRVREYREKHSLPIPKPDVKSNAERQRAYRAKKVCEEHAHVPRCEDYENKKRYNGNYYICFKRDKCKCAICGSTENLCMHHIDGYDEMKPENSNANKMVTLCRKCHSNVHAGTQIPDEILESIGYYDESNESNESCNGAVTTCNTEIEIDKEKEIEKDTERDIDNRAKPARKRVVFTPPTIEEVTAYCQERHNNIDPQMFMDYYESNGWMVGKNRMKDFKATIRRWEQNAKNGYKGGYYKRQNYGPNGVKLNDEPYEEIIPGVF